MRSLPSRRPVNLTLGIVAGWVTTNLFAQAYAADISIGSRSLQFNKDTTIESDFIESHGAYQSTFGVLNLDTNEKTPLLIEVKPSDSPAGVVRPSTRTNDASTQRDFLGTSVGTVVKPIGRFTFKPNTRYVFYLESTYNGRPTGTVYSENSLNPNKEEQVAFTGNPTNLCAEGGTILTWDDTGSKLVRTRAQQDRDFDDFIVRLRDSACGGDALPPPVPGSEAPPSGVVPPGGAVPPVTSQLPPGGGAVPPGGAPPVTGGGFPPLPGGAIGLGLLGVGGVAALLTSGDDESDRSSTSQVISSQSLPPTGEPLPVIVPTTPQEGEPVPEPITVLGSGAAIGFAALMQRRRSQKGQKK